METARIKEEKVGEFKRMLSSNFNFEFEFKLHYSYDNDNEFVYGIYQAAAKKFRFWKTSDVYLAEISTVDLTLPFNSKEWEDLKIVIIDESTTVSFSKFAKEYELKTGKKVLIETL